MSDRCPITVAVEGHDGRSSQSSDTQETSCLESKVTNIQKNVCMINTGDLHILSARFTMRLVAKFGDTIQSKAIVGLRFDYSVQTPSIDNGSCQGSTG
jgi:hypothetical protein